MFEQYRIGGLIANSMETLPLNVSRHTILCHAAQEAGTSHCGYIDWKKENVTFTSLYLGDPLSNWNQICYRVARQLGESTFQI